MYPNKTRNLVLAGILLTGGLVFTSCSVDDKYDLDDVDMTIGLGGGELNLPASSTDVINLSDILELNSGDCVKMQDNGDYVFQQETGSVSPAHPKVDLVTIAKNAEGTLSQEIKLTVAGAGASRAAGATVSIPSTKMQVFAFECSKPTDINSLTHADVKNTLTLSVTFPAALKAVLSEIAEMEFVLPDFLEISDGKGGKLASNKLSFKNVSIANDFKKDIDVIGLVFNETYADGSYLTAKTEDAKVKMLGNVFVKLTAQLPSITAAQLSALQQDNVLKSSLTMADFRITGASGYFNPTIKLDNLGSVRINNVPSFLKDEKACIDLDNPKIILTFSNDMSVWSHVNGTLSAVKKGNTIAVVSVPTFVVEGQAVGSSAPKTSTVCICRHADSETAAYDHVVECSDLSELIQTIPDEITFSAQVQADASKLATIEFGKQYTIQPTYSIQAPIAFAEKANVIYTKTYNGWQDDIEDIDLTKNAEVIISADVQNRIPAYCEVELIPLDAKGNEISANELKVVVSNEIAASANGVDPVETPIKITISQLASNALKKLDGAKVCLHVKAKSASGDVVKAITLNGKRQTLNVNNAKVQLKGGVIFDLN